MVDLTSEIIEFLINKLERYNKIVKFYPGTFNCLEDWKAKINDIIVNLATYGEDEKIIPISVKKDKVEYALEELKKYIFYLIG